MFDLKSPPLVWLFLGLRIEKWDFYFFSFGCGCGDLKRRDFWDWLFGCGFDVEFGACFKKASFLVGLNGAYRARRALGGESRPRKKKILFSKWARSKLQVLACESSPGMQKPGLNPTHCHSYLAWLGSLDRKD